MTDEHVVLTERRDAVLLITLNRPQVRNAMNLALGVELQAVIDAFEADPDLRVAVVTGAPPAFSAGADLKGHRPRGSKGSGLREALTMMETGSHKPIICAVEGFALGAGLELALSCDLIICAEDARMGLPEVRWGLVAAGGGVLRLAKKLPLNMAKAMVLTGEPASAADLHRVGVVHALSPPGEALEVALALARKIAANAPMAVALSKKLIDETAHLSVADAWAFQEPLLAPVFTSEDVSEGIRSFRERRPAVWKNR